MIVGDVFEPARFSDEELSFLLIHLEEPPLVAMYEELPRGVNAAAITQALTRVQELHQMELARAQPWAGFETIRDAIERYQTWSARAREIYRRSGGPQGNHAIPFASQYAWDSRGRAFRGGIGADSAEMVRSEILPDGTRKYFAVPLLSPPGGVVEGLGEFAPWIKAPEEMLADGASDEVIEDTEGENGQIRCSVCGQTETFQVSARHTYLHARKRMAKHLQSIKTDLYRHRALYTKAFR